MLGVQRVAVYDSLDRLVASKRVRRTFRKRGSPSIDAVWLTGEGVLRKLEEGKHGIRRLILPHPATPELDRFAVAVQRDGIPATIIEMTKRARDVLKIEVGWYPGLSNVYFTVGNNWAHVEPHPPIVGDGEAPVFVLGCLNVDLRRFYRKAFDDMWRQLPMEQDRDTPHIDSRLLGASPEELRGLIARYRAAMLSESHTSVRQSS